jgi:UDP-N-acetylmuramoyl-L-alanyl-D-glutamate--2,6-diaminopimelate ligase
VQMIKAILEEAGFRVAVISSLNFKIGRKEWLNETKFTTLSGFQIQKFIRTAVGEKCHYLVLEVSSHALDQYRVWGIKFDTAAITNITREHLDYHETMQHYRRAKQKLFKKVRAAVVNLDMENPEEFLKYKNEEKYGYSTQLPITNYQLPINFQFPNLKFQKIIAENIKLQEDGVNYQVEDTGFSLNLLGEFNVENALAATDVGLTQGISLEIASRALARISGIPGRMESVPNNFGIKIIIDYAVTPDSLEKLYSLIENMKKGRKIIAVFGACGERDRGKRPIMGSIVDKYADYIILTNEDPYREDPWQIINEIEKGISCKKENENFWKIMDRREAIKKALHLAEFGNIVVVTGKGAETSMAIGKKRIPWSDRGVIREVLRELE